MRAGACGLAVAAVAAAPSLGATPLKGKLYSGGLAGAQSKISISLRVSAGGGEIQTLKIGALPIYCPGNGPPGTPSIVFGKARISAAGKFSTKGADKISSGPLKGTVVATLAVTGTFSAGGRVHGTIATSYSGSAKSCSGRSAYSAHA